MINREATIRWKGYDPNDLSPNSNKKVWVVFEDCDRGRWAYFWVCSDTTLCRSCANKKKGKDGDIRLKQSIAAIERWKKPGEKEKIMGERSPFYGIDRSGENNPFYGKLHTKESIIKMIENSPDKNGENNPNYKSEIDDFIKEHKGKYLCGCGCGEVIEIGRACYHSGIPKYIQGHYSKTDEGKKAIIQGNLCYRPKQRNTSIELKMQQILKDNGYEFQTHIPICNICRPDITFEGKKLIIQCDGDYWHNYPDGTEKDREQDKILTENGWRVIRFWEHEINNNIQDCFMKFETYYNLGGNYVIMGS